MRRPVLIIWILFSAGAIHTALTQSGGDSRLHPDTERTVEWQRTFSGTWESYHPVYLSLTYDGDTYLGTVTYGEQNLVFDLYGEPTDSMIQLQEIDSSGRTSGFLILKPGAGRMDGRWWSTDFTRTARISMKEEGTVELNRFKPQVIAVAGNAGNASFELTVQQEDKDLLSGYCWLGDDLFRVSGSCRDPSCERMDLRLFDPHGTTRLMYLVRHRPPEYSVTLENDNAGSMNGSASVVHLFPLTSMRAYRYAATIDCLYPVLGITDFDTWFAGEIDTWMTSITEHLDANEAGKGPPGPGQRWNISAFAWTDLTLVSEDLVSGLLTTYNPLHGDYDRSPFIFDQKSGKPVDLQGFARKAHFASVIADDAAKPNANSDGSMSPSDPKHIVLGQRGFICLTDFSPVSGDTWAGLPYTDYQALLKRNAPIHSLIKLQDRQ
jgi:hypothetical protein